MSLKHIRASKDTNLVTRNCKSDRQCNDKMQKDDSINNGQYNTTQKAKD